MRLFGRCAADATADSVCAWIDRGCGDPGGRFWVLDPIDGTKGFLRGDQYAVALALVVGNDMNDMYASAQRALQRYHSVTSVEDYYSSLPETFVLHQNYPNPFNPSTTIAFDLPRAMTVELTVINVLGQEVTTLLDETMSAGTQSVTWDGIDKSGRPVASGMYFYRLKTDSDVQTKKMLMLK